MKKIDTTNEHKTHKLNEKDKFKDDSHGTVSVMFDTSFRSTIIEANGIKLPIPTTSESEDKIDKPSNLIKFIRWGDNSAAS